MVKSFSRHGNSSFLNPGYSVNFFVNWRKKFGKSRFSFGKNFHTRTIPTENANFRDIDLLFLFHFLSSPYHSFNKIIRFSTNAIQTKSYGIQSPLRASLSSFTIPISINNIMLNYISIWLLSTKRQRFYQIFLLVKVCQQLKGKKRKCKENKWKEMWWKYFGEVSWIDILKKISG